MSDQPKISNGVKIHPPDQTLRTKMGGVKLEHVISPNMIEEAQNVIAQSADDFLAEGLVRAEELEQTNKALQRNPADKGKLLPILIADAFSIKTKAEQSGYDLVSALAKSLQILCEDMMPRRLEGMDLDLIQWHVTSVMCLLKSRLKGSGGPTGAAILAQLELVSPAAGILRSKPILKNTDSE